MLCETAFAQNRWSAQDATRKSLITATAASSLLGCVIMGAPLWPASNCTFLNNEGLCVATYSSQHALYTLDDKSQTDVQPKRCAQRARLVQVLSCIGSVPCRRRGKHACGTCARCYLGHLLFHTYLLARILKLSFKRGTATVPSSPLCPNLTPHCHLLLPWPALPVEQLLQR